MFPPLTFHALDISGEFASLQKVADLFALGCPDYDGRGSEAVAVTIISALFNYPEYKFSVLEHIRYPDRCARFLWAVNYAWWGTRKPWEEQNKGSRERHPYLTTLQEWLKQGLDDKEYRLFVWNIWGIPHIRTPFSEEAHIKSAMCMRDVFKMVPGLPKRDPEYREPELSPEEAYYLMQRKRLRSKSKNFAFLAAAQ